MTQAEKELNDLLIAREKRLSETYAEIRQLQSMLVRISQMIRLSMTDEQFNNLHQQLYGKQKSL